MFFLKVLCFIALFTCASLVYAVEVDLNFADVEQLQQIKGIGPKTAQRIIDERTRAGAFESLDDLGLRVKGIGKKRALKMQQNGLKINSQYQTQTSISTSRSLSSNSIRDQVRNSKVKKAVRHLRPDKPPKEGAYLLKPPAN